MTAAKIIIYAKVAWLRLFFERTKLALGLYYKTFYSGKEYHCVVS
jgi:hypothetical protein